MKKHIPIICCVLSCLLTVLCLFRISALEDRLYSLQNSVSNMHSVLHDDIRNIATNVKNSVEEGNNLLSTSSYSLEDPNLKNGTVDLSCIVTLKEFEPDGTTAVLTCNDKEYPMNLKNGDFVVMVTDGVLEYLHVPNPEETMQEIIESINTNHPGILAKKILERVLLFTGGKVSDDMTILATCIWEK